MRWPKTNTFQFHQGLSQPQLQISNPGSMLSFNSIKDYHTYGYIINETSQMDIFQFHQGLSYFQYETMVIFIIYISFNSIKDYQTKHPLRDYNSVNVLSIPSRIIFINLSINYIYNFLSFNSIKDYLFWSPSRPSARPHSFNSIKDYRCWSCRTRASVYNQSFNSIKDYLILFPVVIPFITPPLSIPSRII